MFNVKISCLAPQGLLIAGLYTSAFSVMSVNAQITLDGTLGAGGALTGPDYQITAELGRQIESNLFHSFGQFNINTQESATFSGPASVENIIARVTGGTRSHIDGTLRSTIPNADLYLLNPAGILFGENARLDLQGSFHTSTADYMRLGDDGRFEATQTENSVLTAAPPSAFGFLGDNPAGIDVRGSLLEMQDGRSINLVGGTIGLSAGRLVASGGGDIGLMTANSAGEVDLAGVRTTTSQGGTTRLADGSAIELSGTAPASVFINTGQLILENAAIVADRQGQGDGPAVEADGSMIVNAAAIDLISGNINSISSGSGDAATIAVTTDRLIISDNRSEAGGINSLALNTGAAGDVLIHADTLELRGNTEIASRTAGTGEAGNVTVMALNLDISDNGRISSDTLGLGAAGVVKVEAGQLRLFGTDAAPFGFSARIASEAQPGSSGNAGAVEVIVQNLELGDGAVIGSVTFGAGDAGRVDVIGQDIEMGAGAISSATFAAGNGGSVRVEAENIVLSAFGDPFVTGKFSQIDSSALPGSTGNAGTVEVVAGNLEVRNGATITSATFGPGNGNLVRVDADRLLISGGPGAVVTGIGGFVAFPTATGNAPAVAVTAGDLEIRDGGRISTSTFGIGNAGSIDIEANHIMIVNSAAGGDFTGIDSAVEAGATGSGGSVAIRTPTLEIMGGEISTATAGGGRGGDIAIDVDQLSIGNKGRIAALSGSAAIAGNIDISVRDSLRLDDGTITGQAQEADGGNIRIQAGRLVRLLDSQVTTQVSTGQGGGGNIVMAADFLVLQNGRVSANAFGGDGGNILITVEQLLSDPESTIEASSALGIDGNIDIQAPDTDLGSQLLVLSQRFLDASKQLRDPCTTRVGEEIGTFVLADQSNLLISPDDPLLSARSADALFGATPFHRPQLADQSVDSPCTGALRY